MYQSAWKAEALAIKTNNHKILVKFVKKYNFFQYRIPKALCSHFCHQSFEVLVGKYSVTHKIATAYQPQISGKVKVSNHEIKFILEKMV